jgi:V/A-type H+-transporting ATPase subunit E
MDVQLKELIERINTEGIQNAEQKARMIIHEAEQQAGEILAQAQKEAGAIVGKAKSEAAGFEASGREALKQAGRDLVLAVQQQLTGLFNGIVARETRGALTAKVVEEAVVTMFRSWAEKGLTSGQILLSDDQGEKLQKALLARLAEEVRNGLRIELLPGISAGFRLVEKEGVAYYDFTDQGISEFFISYLSPRLSEIMREAVKKGS